MKRIAYNETDRSHERVISISTYSPDENHIVIEGRLRELRLKDYYLFTGERKSSGLLHDLIIRMLLKNPELLIEDIEAEMAAVPREECFSIEACVEKIKGMRIEQGFTMKVRSMLSGVNGCTHMTHLLLTMAPAIMQGMWAVTAEKPPGEREDMTPDKISTVAEGLKNTCYAWREDGTAFSRLKSLIKKMSAQ